MGGTVPSVEVSAKEKIGIEELLEMILLVAEMQDLKADLSSPAEGLIIESYMDSFKGPVATAIVQRGILNKKNVIATDLAIAKVKSILNFQNKEVEQGMPSQPVIILGFDKVPAVGAKFKTYSTAEEAVTEIQKEKPKREIVQSVVESDPNKKVLNIILKGDVFGSLEAIDGMIKNLPQEKIGLRILKSEVGDVNENDVKLAEMSKATIIGFRVKVTNPVMQYMKADTEKSIRIKTFNVIYELIQDIRLSMEKNLEAETVRKDIGKLKTLMVFWGEKNRQIVGGRVSDGEFKKGLKLEVVRDNAKVGSGKIVNLQRNKKDVDVAKKGDEAGILFEGNVKIEKGDIIVGFAEERRKGEL
jgi:translation initiation factor IF-2